MESSKLPNIKREDRRIIRTKKAINSAFLVLIKRKDISKITVKELCDLANINRKTFYSYYSNIFDVLAHIENDTVLKFENSISNLKSEKTLFTISDIFTCVGNILNSNSEFMHELVQIDLLEGLEKKVKAIIKNTIFDAMSEVRDYDIDFLNISLEYIISGVVSMYIEWFYAENKIPYELLSEITIKFVNANIKSIEEYGKK